MIAMDITSERRKRALLLHYAGTEVDEIFNTLYQTGDDEEYKQLQSIEGGVTTHFLGFRISPRHKINPT